MKFVDVKLKDKMYSVIYGQGKVINVIPKERRIDGFFVFTVEYMNKEQVHYTEEGIPSWCSKEFCGSTLHYLSDIDLTLEDFTTSCKILTKKKILEFREKDKLKARMPSGIWLDANLAPDLLIEKYIKEKKHHLFKKI